MSSTDHPSAAEGMGQQGPPMSMEARRRMARGMRLLNVPMRRVLGLPFPTPLSRRLMLLFFTGRKTGRLYRQPVSYVADGDTLLSPGGGNWKRNLREGEPIRIRLRGRDIAARAQFVRDATEVERLLRKMMAANPRLTSFVPFIGADGRIDPVGLAAGLAHGFCIVRWHVHGPWPEGRQ
jgi:deazaflavin-dependent oxidoreductase (nitroreductase family)